MTPMEQMLKGRAPLRCACGAELFVTVRDEGGVSVGSFVPCKCGSTANVIVPSGSIMGAMQGVSVWQVWGPSESADK
jgi:hypothetical protein